MCEFIWCGYKLRVTSQISCRYAEFFCPVYTKPTRPRLEVITINISISIIRSLWNVQTLSLVLNWMINYLKLSTISPIQLLCKFTCQTTCTRPKNVFVSVVVFYFSRKRGHHSLMNTPPAGKFESLTNPL